MTADRPGPVVVVGPGARFLSGVSHYTARLARAFDDHHAGGGAALLLRRLCPTAIYPGRDRVGAHPHEVLGLDGVDTFDGVDWFWGLSLPRAVAWLRRRRPSVVVLQYWTGTAAHTYLVLAAVARRLGATVVVEFHETVDVGEAKVPGVRPYVRTAMAALSRLADGFVVHSRADVAAVHAEFPSLWRLPSEVVHHGPFDQLAITRRPPAERGGHGRPVRFVFFGVLRDYKGVDVLATAFAALVADGLDVHLTVAGEPWPDATPALEALAELPPERVTLRFGHLPDDELASVVSDADVVVLPYRRSSASGPLHAVMTAGLPVVTSDIPALAEVTAGYSGAVLTQPDDPGALADAMRRAVPLIGADHVDPHDWATNVSRFETIFERAARQRQKRSRRSRRAAALRVAP